MAYVEHSSGKHSPSLIHLESSRFPRRYGISHSHSSTATRWAISGRYGQEPGDRRRVQSWADNYFHSMGSLCGFTYLLPHRLWALITVVIPSRLSPFCYDFIAGTSLSQRLSSGAVEL